MSFIQQFLDKAPPDKSGCPCDKNHIVSQLVYPFPLDRGWGEVKRRRLYNETKPRAFYGVHSIRITTQDKHVL